MPADELRAPSDQRLATPAIPDPVAFLMSAEPEIEGRMPWSSNATFLVTLRCDGVDGPVLPRQYVVGWAKRGPSGLIGTNGPDSQATVEKLLEDLPELGTGAPLATREAIDSVLAQRGVEVVDFADWQRLDEDEVARGAERGKAREKYLSVEDMVQAVLRLRSAATAARD